MFVLRELWRGNITPSERHIRKNSEYATLLHENTELEHNFCETLTAEQKKAYNDIYGGQVRIMSISEEEAFIQGFRIGAGMLLDVIEDYKGQFRMIGEAG